MAYLFLPDGSDFFKEAYNVGFQDGMCERPQDKENTALEGFDAWYEWDGGYIVGYKCGREYRLARYACRVLREQGRAQHEKEQRRLKQKHSSVFWFIVWSIAERWARVKAWL